MYKFARREIAPWTIVAAFEGRRFSSITCGRGVVLLLICTSNRRLSECVSDGLKRRCTRGREHGDGDEWQLGRREI